MSTMNFLGTRRTETALSAVLVDCRPWGGRVAQFPEKLDKKLVAVRPEASPRHSRAPKSCQGNLLTEYSLLQVEQPRYRRLRHAGAVWTARISGSNIRKLMRPALTHAQLCVY